MTAHVRLYGFLAGLFGLAAVAIGAFGAHGVSDPATETLISTGAHYHVVHTLAAIASLAFVQWGARGARFATPCFFAGIALFSGSLYAHALGAPAGVGFLTPIGGVVLLVGWAILAWSALAAPRAGRAQKDTP